MLFTTASSRFLGEKVIVFAFIGLGAVQLQPVSFYFPLICLVSQGDGDSTGHSVVPGRAFSRSREQEPAAAYERPCDLCNQSALDFSFQQEEEAPGDHGIEGPAEEVRLLCGRAL